MKRLTLPCSLWQLARSAQPHASWGWLFATKDGDRIGIVIRLLVLLKIIVITCFAYFDVWLLF